MPVLMVSEKTSPQRGLLEEALDPPVLAGDHDAELERVGDALQGQRRRRAAVAMELDQRRQVDVGQRRRR